MLVHGVHPVLDSTPCILLMENHDQAYHVWQSAGLHDRVLVHIDAHDDVLWAPEPASINIANYICPALKDGLVREVFWVVPDETWKDSRTLKPVVQRLKKIIGKYPGQRKQVMVEQDQIYVMVLGKYLRVCPLGNLPQLAEDVLLDIDVDYLINPRAYSGSDHYRVLPWVWPSELVARLKAKRLRTDLVTIAYSVEGGYTPLKWKYLGDELARRLQMPGDGTAYIQGMELMREGALAGHRKEITTAEAKYLKATELLPDHPAPYLHLAYQYAEQERIGDAQECYRRALTLDPSYRTAFNSAGIWYYSDRRYPEAEREHRRTLTLDPEDAYAHLGLGQLAARRKQWREAEARLKKALELNGQLVDAYRTLGKLLAKQGRQREAIAAYEQSLQLTLRGYKPLEGPILTNGEDRRLLDPDHFEVHAILGRLYDVLKDNHIAIVEYRMALAAGCDGLVIRNRLSRLYLKQRQWRQAAQEGWSAVKIIPGDLQKAGRRSWRRLRRAIKDRFRALRAN